MPWPSETMRVCIFPSPIRSKQLLTKQFSDFSDSDFLGRRIINLQQVDNHKQWRHLTYKLLSRQRKLPSGFQNGKLFSFKISQIIHFQMKYALLWCFQIELSNFFVYWANFMLKEIFLESQKKSDWWKAFKLVLTFRTASYLSLGSAVGSASVS